MRAAEQHEIVRGALDVFAATSQFLFVNFIRII